MIAAVRHQLTDDDLAGAILNEQHDAGQVARRSLSVASLAKLTEEVPAIPARCAAT